MPKETTTITEEEVVHFLKDFPAKKSSGPYSIKRLHHQDLGIKAIQHLAKFLTNAINTSLKPQTWNRAKIFLLPKPKIRTWGILIAQLAYYLT